MPISLKNLGCASQSSTAICTTTASSATTPHRLNSYLSDQYKNLSSTSPAPCISDHLPFSPRKKNFRRDSSAEITDYLRRRRSSADIKDAAPTGSSSCRYLLLRDTTSFREVDRAPLRDTNPLALVLSEPPVPPVGSTKSYSHRDGCRNRRDDSLRLSPHRSRALPPPSQRMVKAELDGSTYSPAAVNGRSGFNHVPIVKPSAHQVVVLRVSLHCKGCENKLRKHLSKMQGVTSYSIDLDTRKVTVIGSVTPLDVLNNISKVKNAQFWPSPANSTSSASSSSHSASSTSEFSY